MLFLLKKEAENNSYLTGYTARDLVDSMPRT